MMVPSITEGGLVGLRKVGFKRTQLFPSPVVKVTYAHLLGPTYPLDQQARALRTTVGKNRGRPSSSEGKEGHTHGKVLALNPHFTFHSNSCGISVRVLFPVGSLLESKGGRRSL